MTDYDALFDETTPDQSVFADKQALDPLATPATIQGRAPQEHKLATILNGLIEGYLPPTVAIHGPPGTGKTVTTRRVAAEFAHRHDTIAVEYVNLKESRSIFSAANEIHLELTGDKRGAYEGLDGVFEGIWEALEDYPEWTVLILDEIDHITQDTNYAPSEFLYRLLRGEGKLKREIQLSAWLISNALLEVDLRLDSRVQSTMGDEEVFFSPYGYEELRAICTPRIEAAFQDGAVPADVFTTGIELAASQWGDARKALTLFRQAGETANARGLDFLTEACLRDNIEATEAAAVREKLLSLPPQYFYVLVGVTHWTDASANIKQPITSEEAKAAYESLVEESTRVGSRAFRGIIDNLETMGLVETWVESKGRAGTKKHMRTTFDPKWVGDVMEDYVKTSVLVDDDE